MPDGVKENPDTQHGAAAYTKADTSAVDKGASMASHTPQPIPLPIVAILGCITEIVDHRSRFYDSCSPTHSLSPNEMYQQPHTLDRQYGRRTFDHEFDSECIVPDNNDLLAWTKCDLLKELLTTLCSGPQCILPEILFSLLRHHSSSKSERKAEKSVAPTPPTVELVSVIVTLVDFVCTSLHAEHKKNLYLDLARTVVDFFHSLSDEELKTQPKDVFGDLLDRIRVLLYQVVPNRRQVELFLERHSLKFSIKLLQCPFLERRLLGLNQVRRLVDTASHVNASIAWTESDSGSRLLPADVNSYLQDEGFVEILFGDNLHVQLVRRSAEILKFMNQNTPLSHAHLDMIWEASRGKHESVVNAIYAVISSLACVLTLEQATHLFSCISSVPLMEYQEELLLLVRDFTSSAIANFNAPAAMGHANDEHGPAFIEQVLWKQHNWFGVDLFWVIFNEPNNPVSREIRNQSFNMLLECLHWYLCRPLRHHFLRKCLENLKNMYNVPLSLKLMMHIINTFAPDCNVNNILSDTNQQQFSSEDGRPKVIEVLNEQDRIVDLLFHDITAHVSGKISSHSMDLSGFLTPYQQLQERLNFVLYIYENSPLTLTFAQISVLWDHVVTPEAQKDYRDLFFVWLHSTLSKNSERSTLIGVDSAEQILSELFPKLRAAEVSVHEFALIEFLFKWLNWKQNRLVLNHQKELLHVVAFDLIGTNYIWDIAFASEDARVSKKAMHLLNQIHCRLGPDVLPRINEKYEECIQKCMDWLRKCAGALDSGGLSASDIESNELQLERCFSMLNICFDDFQGEPEPCHNSKLQRFLRPGALTSFDPIGDDNKATMELNMPLQDYKITLQIVVVHQKRNFQLCVNSMQTVHNLKDQVADCLAGGSQAQSIRLICNGKELKDPTKRLYQEQVADKSTVHVVMKPQLTKQPSVPASTAKNAVHPNRILSRPFYFDQLFSLLSSSLHGGGKREILADKCWSLLMKLPTNHTMLAELRSICVNDAGDRRSSDFDWNRMLDPEHVQRLHYSLQIIASIMLSTKEADDDNTSQKDATEVSQVSIEQHDKEAGSVKPAGLGSCGDHKLQEQVDSQSWAKAFVDRGGLRHLVKILPNNDFLYDSTESSNSVRSQNLECLSLLIKVLLVFVKDYGATCIAGAEDAADTSGLKRKASPKPVSSQPRRIRRKTSVGEFDVEGDQVGVVSLFTQPVLEKLFGLIVSASSMCTIPAAAKTVASEADGSCASGCQESSISKKAGDTVSAVVSDIMELLQVVLCTTEMGAKCKSFILRDHILERWVENVLVRSPRSRTRQVAADGLYKICHFWYTHPTAADKTIHYSIFLYVFGFMCDLESFSTSWRFTSAHFMRLVLRLYGDISLTITHTHTATPERSILESVVKLDSIGSQDMPPHADVDLEIPRKRRRQTVNFAGDGAEDLSDTSSLLRKVFSLLKAYPLTESNASSLPDQTLIGLMNLARILLTANTRTISEPAQSGSKDTEGALSHLQPSVVCCETTGKIVEEMGMIEHVFHSFLFQTREIHTPEQLRPVGEPEPRRCKSQPSRSGAFQLLQEMSETSPSNRLRLVDLLIRNHAKGGGSTDWNYVPNQMKQSSTKYVGLLNLGATCYMNSLVQQLFMHPEFRYGILSQPENPNVEERADDLVYQLQCIFGNLQESRSKYYDARGFCQAYKDYDNQPMHHGVQMDVNEFFNVLFDKLEHLLKGRAKEKLMDHIFGGKISNQLICKDCPHRSERSENFYILSLEVKNKRSIKESLELYVEGEMLEGDNQYMCQTCKKKVDTLKRCCIKELPRNLILHLKRFEFDFDSMTKIKINDYCEFPMVLDMAPYTEQYLEQKAQESAVQIERSTMDGAKSTVEAERDVPLFGEGEPNQSKSSLYHLTGVLVHTGTCNSGHYYSFIKERQSNHADNHTGQWFQFNDTKVDPLDLSDLKEQCFGGVDTLPQNNQMQRTNMEAYMQKPYNAYMLFYERIEPEQAGSDTQSESETAKVRAADLVDCGPENLPKSLDVVEAGKLVPRSIFESCWEENNRAARDRTIFETAYLQLCYRVATAPIPRVVGKEETLADDNLPCLRLGALFCMNTLSRSYAKSEFSRWDSDLIELFAKNTLACRWLVKTLTDNPEWLADLLLHCTATKFRKSFSRVLMNAIMILRKEERKKHGDDCLKFVEEAREAKSARISESPTTLQVEGLNEDVEDEDSSDDKFEYTPEQDSFRLILEVLNISNVVFKHWKSAEQYWDLLRQFAELGETETKLYIALRVPLMCIQFYLGSNCTCPSQKYNINTNVKKCRKKHSGKLGSMLQLLAHLVTSIPKDSLQDESVGLGAEGYHALVRNISFIESVMEDGVNVDATSSIICYLSRDSPSFSDLVCTVLCKSIEEQTVDMMQPYFDAIDMFLAIDDDLFQARTKKTMTTLMKVFKKNARYHEDTIAVLRWLQSHAKRPNSIVRQNLLKQTAWAAFWIFHDQMDFRDETCKLLIALASDPELELPHGPASAATRTDDHYDERSAGAVLALLLKIFPKIGPMMDNPKPRRSYVLPQYFHGLAFLLQTSEEKSSFAQMHLTEFFDLFGKINKQELSEDENKLAMVRFMLHLVTDCQSNLQLLYAHPQEAMKYGQILMRMTVTVDHENPTNRLFNEQCLPALYDIMLLICQESKAFFGVMLEDNVFDWTVNHCYTKTHIFPRTQEKLLQVFSLADNFWGGVWREKQMKKLVETCNLQMSTNGLALMKLFKLLLKEDEVIRFFWCSRGFTLLADFFRNPNYSSWQNQALAINMLLECNYDDPQIKEAILSSKGQSLGPSFGVAVMNWICQGTNRNLSHVSDLVDFYRNCCLLMKRILSFPIGSGQLVRWVDELLQAKMRVDQGWCVDTSSATEEYYSVVFELLAAVSTLSGMEIDSREVSQHLYNPFVMALLCQLEIASSSERTKINVDFCGILSNWIHRYKFSPALILQRNDRLQPLAQDLVLALCQDEEMDIDAGTLFATNFIQNARELCTPEKLEGAVNRLVERLKLQLQAAAATETEAEIKLVNKVSVSLQLLGALLLHHSPPGSHPVEPLECSQDDGQDEDNVSDEFAAVRQGLAIALHASTLESLDDALASTKTMFDSSVALKTSSAASISNDATTPSSETSSEEQGDVNMETSVPESTDKNQEEGSNHTESKSNQSAPMESEDTQASTSAQKTYGIILQTGDVAKSTRGVREAELLLQKLQKVVHQARLS